MPRPEHEEEEADDNLSLLRVAFSNELHELTADWSRRRGLEQLVMGKPSPKKVEEVYDICLAMLAALAHEAGAIASLVSQGLPELDAGIENVLVEQYRTSRDGFRGQLRDRMI